jgi:hypothetical protein
MLFLDPDVRGRHVDWEPVARGAVGFVRAAAGPPYEPRLANLIGELSLADPDFRTWWAERHVNYASVGARTYTHPLTGPYTLDWQVLRLADEDQTITVMTARDPRSLAALHRLGSTGATR